MCHSWRSKSVRSNEIERVTLQSVGSRISAQLGIRHIVDVNVN